MPWDSSRMHRAALQMRFCASVSVRVVRVRHEGSKPTANRLLPRYQNWPNCWGVVSHYLSQLQSPPIVLSFPVIQSIPKHHKKQTKQSFYKDPANPVKCEKWLTMKICAPNVPYHSYRRFRTSDSMNCKHTEWKCYILPQKVHNWRLDFFFFEDC